MYHARAPFQVLVLPFRRCLGVTEFALFRRADAGYWQWLSGGGDLGELPWQAAAREMNEEANIPRSTQLYQLDSLASVPRNAFPSAEWAADILVVPEYCFAVEISDHSIALSDEHTDWQWAPYARANKLLRWDSNKVALWELEQRLQQGALIPVPPTMVP
jgi:dATP pyrophosphohydrolase